MAKKTSLVNKRGVFRGKKKDSGKMLKVSATCKPKRMTRAGGKVAGREEREKKNNNENAIERVR